MKVPLSLVYYYFVTSRICQHFAKVIYLLQSGYNNNSNTSSGHLQRACAYFRCLLLGAFDEARTKFKFLMLFRVIWQFVRLVRRHSHTHTVAHTHSHTHRASRRLINMKNGEKRNVASAAFAVRLSLCACQHVCVCVS